MDWPLAFAVVGVAWAIAWLFVTMTKLALK